MFDLSRQWLRLPGGPSLPMDHELLGLDPGECRVEVIEEAALRQTARLRPYQTGPYAEECTRLLNEIARAELALLDQAQRDSYDVVLVTVPAPGVGESCAVAAQGNGVDKAASVGLLALDSPALARFPAWHGRRSAPRSRFRAAPPLAAGVMFLVLFAVTALGIVSVLGGRTLDLGRFSTADPVGAPLFPDPASAGETNRIGEVRCVRGPMPVYAVAFSPDGRFALSGGGGYVKAPGNTVVPRDCAARLWDLETGQEVQRFIGHTAPVRCVCFSPDGRRVLTGGGGYEPRAGAPVAADCTVRLWDAGRGSELRRFTGHTAPVTSVAFFPDGHAASSASRDGTVRLWDVATGAELRRLEPEPGAVNCVAVSPDGRYLLCGGEEGVLWLWRLADRQGPRGFPRVEGRISCVAFSPDGRQALCASGGQEPVGSALRQWDLQTASEVHTYAGPGRSITSVAFSTDGRRAISAGSDRTVLLSDLTTGRELYSFGGHRSLVEAVALSPDGRRALSAGHDGTVRLWALPQ